MKTGIINLRQLAIDLIVKMKLMNFMLILILVFGCNSVSSEVEEPEFADVKKVEVQGKENAFNFSVMLKSPDTGCEQYADWWEVISSDGKLIYRRILAHSHVSEQPFTRSGGEVKIASDQRVWVRAHMNNTGYGGLTMKGSVDTGFLVTPWPDGFAEGVDKVAPLPTGCAF
jgi:hypothetical protein